SGTAVVRDSDAGWPHPGCQSNVSGEDDAYREMSLAAQLMVDQTKTIELWPCGYDARCNVKNCRARATTVARSNDSGGRPIRQYELCSVHAEQVAEREKGRAKTPGRG